MQRGRGGLAAGGGRATASFASVRLPGTQVVAVALAFGVACGSPSDGALSGVATVDSLSADALTLDGASDAPNHRDPGVASPDATAETGADPGATTCRVVGFDFRLGQVEVDGGDLSFAEPLVGAGGVYVHLRVDPAAPGDRVPGQDTEILFVDATTDARAALTDNSWDDLLLDARGGAVLAYRDRQTNALPELVVLDHRAGLPPDEQVVWNPPGVPVGAQGWTGDFDNAARRRVAPGRAAWLEQGATPGASTIYLYDGGAARAISGAPATHEPPQLDAETATVVWSTWDGGDREVVAWYQGARRILTDDDVDDAFPVTSGGRVFWLAGGALAVHDLSSAESRILDPGRCGPPSTDGGLAVAACGEPAASGGGAFWEGGHHLVATDGTSTWKAHAVGAEYSLFSARISGGVVAWAEYLRDAAWGSGGTPGTVRVTLADGTLPPVTLASITSGCWWCQVPWPPPLVGLEGHVVAWNYAVPSDPEAGHPNAHALGYAALTPREDCE